MERCVIAASLVVGLSAVDGARVSHRSTCGVKGGSNSSRIVNGADASECEWRWQVGLVYSSESRPSCGGMLIDIDWVLTAAHCVGFFPKFNVIAGVSDVFDTGHKQLRKPVQLVVHPQYIAPSDQYDLALLRLDSPIVPDSCVGTVCLPTKGADVAPGSTCWITGWGLLFEDGWENSAMLQEAQVKVISNEECLAAYDGPEYDAMINPSTLCAQGRSESGEVTDACEGDSGGPLVCESAGKWTVYGATSWGKGCAREAYPGVWARVHEVLDWIDETLAANA